MTATVGVPAYLRASIDGGGPARAAWLAALPDRVEELTDRGAAVHRPARRQRAV